MLESLLNKVAGFQACNVIKKILRHRCKYWEIFKKTYFEKHLPTAASDDRIMPFKLQI